MTPEDLDRALQRDAEGVRASPRFAAAVIAAVRREAKAPPPIPFPWARAAPGVAAALLIVALAVASFVSAPRAETPARVPVVLERAAEITVKVGDSVASLDARQSSIWLVVVALSVVPVLAPLVLIRDGRKG
ncbi:MAG TPA: hypothetical protein VMV37_05610 [Gammaproteobacteria bacterium]|nr:hypothetical protein [Gammaproteobacteria bacterium]